MPSDEANDEKPRVYQHESDGDRLGDVFGDDKVDVNRMAEDEAPVTKREPPLAATASTSCPTNGARLPGANGHGVNGPPNGLLNRSGRTAFTNVVSNPPGYLVYSPGAHFLFSQQYNGLLGNRFPYASPHGASLSSPSMGSPTYGATLNGFYPPPPTWFPFDASKAGFYTPPLVFGVPAQMSSPNFGIEQLQLSMAGMAAALRTTQMMESPFHPSPLQSPDTGTTIAPIGSKVSTNSAPLKVALSNGAQNNGFCIPSAAFNQSSITTDPLSSMGRIVVPMATTSVTHIANSLASSATVKTNQNENDSNNEKINKDSSKLPLSKSAGDASRHIHRHNGHAINSGGSLSSNKSQKDANKTPHIKKPLNAFMLYMKEMRPKVMQEAGLKERQSAEINRILGRRWHAISREEQQKYYEMARKVRQEHLQKYPGWSARDNYAIHKKKKRKRDKTMEGLDNLEAKKCRARFGLDQQTKWCKHCRRKKKCLWFKDGDNDGTDTTTDASPPMQVTSTSQFSNGVGDDHLGKNVEPPVASESARPSATNGSTKTPDVVNSPQAIVTSTTGVQSNGGNVVVSSDDEDDEDDLIESCTDYEDENDDDNDGGGGGGGGDDDDDDDDDEADAKRLKISTNLESTVETKNISLLCKNSLTPTAVVNT